ncbi:PepSY-associated TM helix domain-containing protein [Phenylobacterium sp. LjRoot225]|uniref:PepSY-associated TM helix domain-containing protein n=1 Tax=Phenylobacterium sp. LjRoot225 TaxID=3342285 RepID=UPI003ED1535D
MRTDVVKTYLDIHTWVGIFSGLALFIAFYAGAVTMFESPLQRWAQPPSTLPAPVALDEAPRLAAAVIARHPEAGKDYAIHVATGPDTPARMSWTVHAPGAEREEGVDYAAALTPSGELVVAQATATPVAEFVDVLHRQVGLPFDHEVAMPIMGVVALLYGVALVSGVIILLPSLVKDLFLLRFGKNFKRMWLDVHNALGILSLPFHIIMALSAVVFAFHDQFYDTQNLVLYDRKIEQIWKRGEPPTPAPAPGAAILPPAELMKRVQAEAPSFRIQTIGYRTNAEGVTVARVEGFDPHFIMRGSTFGYAVVDPYSGAMLETAYMPGLASGWNAVVTSFFALHFGSFGGDAVRWGYFALGLAGAFLFYSGNLLWIEARRKRMNRKAGEVPQSRSTRVLGALTTGISLGSIAGISLTIAAAKWLPGRVADLQAAHSLIYYAAFLAAVGWAFWRGAARSGPELLFACAAATALIPLSSLLGVAGLTWNHGGAARLVDVVALVGVPAFIAMARLSRRRGLEGPRDSVWSTKAMTAAPVRVGADA